MPDAHPLLGPLAALVGPWVGEGTGRLPGHPEFVWNERLAFGTVGTPVLSFSQRTTRPDCSPFHAEDGWVRVPLELQGDGREAHVEVAVTSPTGVLEALVGSMVATDGGFVLDCTSTTVVGTPGAATVHETRRRWTLVDGRLSVDFWMATPTHPDPFHHLTTRLRRAA